jgi:ubiquinone/menaquinone biosynthesis C-methylase UbiE
MNVSVAEGYRLWSSTYDETPNPLVALESRLLAERLCGICGQRMLDAGSGTGRWMSWAQARGASVLGIDLSPEMLRIATAKPGLAGLVVRADIRAIPLPGQSVDLAICSLTLGYLESVTSAIQELARVARRLIVSDLHPAALEHGWTRSFRSEGRKIAVEHFAHSAAELEQSARQAGLSRCWQIEAAFDEPERELFRRAGKEDAWYSARKIPAVIIMAWEKP